MTDTSPPPAAGGLVHFDLPTVFRCGVELAEAAVVLGPTEWASFPIEIEGPSSPHFERWMERHNRLRRIEEETHRLKRSLGATGPLEFRDGETDGGPKWECYNRQFKETDHERIVRLSLVKLATAAIDLGGFATWREPLWDMRERGLRLLVWGIAQLWEGMSEAERSKVRDRLSRTHKAIDWPGNPTADPPAYDGPEEIPLPDQYRVVANYVSCHRDYLDDMQKASNTRIEQGQDKVLRTATLPQFVEAAERVEQVLQTIARRAFDSAAEWVDLYKKAFWPLACLRRAHEVQPREAWPTPALEQRRVLADAAAILLRSLTAADATAACAPEDEKKALEDFTQAIQRLREIAVPANCSHEVETVSSDKASAPASAVPTELAKKKSTEQPEGPLSGSTSMTNAPVNPFRHLANLAFQFHEQALQLASRLSGSTVGRRRQSPDEWGPTFQNQEKQLTSAVEKCLQADVPGFQVTEVERRVRAVQNHVRAILLWQRDAPSPSPEVLDREVWTAEDNPVGVYLSHHYRLMVGALEELQTLAVRFDQPPREVANQPQEHLTAKFAGVMPSRAPLSRLALPGIAEAIRELYRSIERPAAANWQAPAWLVEQYKKTTMGEEGLQAILAGIRDQPSQTWQHWLIRAAANEVLNRMMPPRHHKGEDCPEITESNLDQNQKVKLLELRELLSPFAVEYELTNNRSKALLMLSFLESVLAVIDREPTGQTGHLKNNQMATSEARDRATETPAHLSQNPRDAIEAVKRRVYGDAYAGPAGPTPTWRELPTLLDTLIRECKRLDEDRAALRGFRENLLESFRARGVQWTWTPELQKAWGPADAELNAFRSRLDDPNSAKPNAAPSPGDNGSFALLRVLTNGVVDDRIEKATRVLGEKLTVNKKLAKISALIPIPATASAEQLGKMLWVSKQAVMRTDWWKQNRKGEKENLVGRRRELHRHRAKSYETPSEDDE
jgi:hypothetical protein